MSTFRDRQHNIMEINQMLLEAALKASGNKDTHLNPKNMYHPNSLLFIQYIQIPMLLVITVLIIVLHRLLWSSNFMSRYGLMSLYTVIEITIVFTESFVVVMVTAMNKDYVLYDWCYPYHMLLHYIPLILTFLCRWLRTAQAFHRCAIVYLPLTYNKYVNLKSFVLFMVVLVLVASGMVYIHHLSSMTFDKTIALDREEMKLVEICSIDQNPKTKWLQDINIDHLNLVTRGLLSEVLPMVLMAVFSFALVKKIRKQAAFRRQFQLRSKQKITSDDDRILRVVTLTTIFSIINIAPIVVALVHRIVCKCEETTFLELTEIIYKSLRIMEFLVTFFWYAYLSASFRNFLTKVYNCCCGTPKGN